MSQLNLHRHPPLLSPPSPPQRVIAAPVALIATLTQPQKLFDINCRSHIISCHTLSGIYCWSHWLGAEPPIKFLKKPWGLEKHLSPLHQALSPCAQINHANTHRWEDDTDNTFMQLGWYDHEGDEACAQHRLIVFYLMGVWNRGERQGGFSKELKEQKWNYLWL